MTFIASVIAKNGIAMVADSFVTTMKQSIDSDKFIKYLKAAKTKKANISISDVLALFQKTPSHTRNYADKLFKFDKYSALTTTGSAYINQIEIKDLIRSIASKMMTSDDDPVHLARDIDDVLKEFCNHLRTEVIQHLQTLDCDITEFIFSHFNNTLNKPQVFLIKIKKIQKSKFNPNDPDIVTYEDQSHFKVITDGQNSFVERLIFGSLYNNVDAIKADVIHYITKTFKPKKQKKQEVVDHINDISFLQSIVVDDMLSINFRELSIQEAVDLAALLVKIIMDIQIYTEKIPTVGGVIRSAIISKENGFEWISGDKIIPSKII